MTQLTKAFDAPSYADLKQTLEEQMGSMSAERYINFYNKFAQKTDPNGTRYADLFTPQHLKRLMHHMDDYDMEDRSRHSRMYNVREYFALYDTFKDVPGMADAFQDRELSEYCIKHTAEEAFFHLRAFFKNCPETYKKFRQEWQERAAPSSQCASQMNLAL